MKKQVNIFQTKKQNKSTEIDLMKWKEVIDKVKVENNDHKDAHQSEKTNTKTT